MKLLCIWTSQRDSWGFLTGCRGPNSRPPEGGHFYRLHSSQLEFCSGLTGSKNVPCQQEESSAKKGSESFTVTLEMSEYISHSLYFVHTSSVVVFKEFVTVCVCVFFNRSSLAHHGPVISFTSLRRKTLTLHKAALHCCYLQQHHVRVQLCKNGWGPDFLKAMWLLCGSQL